MTVSPFLNNSLQSDIVNRIEKLLNNKQHLKESRIDQFILGPKRTLNINNDRVIASEKIHFYPGSKICLTNKAKLTLESKNILSL